MSERAAFIRAICEEPVDDVRRLVFADWLDEFGDEADGGRAELIRVSIELTSQRGWPEDNRGEELLLKRKELEEKHDRHWRSGLLLASRSHPVVGHTDGSAAWIYSITYDRAFISTIELPCEAFMRLAADLFAAHPITEVRLTDREPHRNAFGSFMWSEVGDDAIGPPPRPCRAPSPLVEMMRLDQRQRHTSLTWVSFPTVDVAHAALSRACASYGRELAGLPPLVNHATV